MNAESYQKIQRSLKVITQNSVITVMFSAEFTINTYNLTCPYLGLIWDCLRLSSQFSR